MSACSPAEQADALSLTNLYSHAKIKENRQKD